MGGDDDDWLYRKAMTERKGRKAGREEGREEVMERWKESGGRQKGKKIVLGDDDRLCRKAVKGRK